MGSLAWVLNGAGGLEERTSGGGRSDEPAAAAGGSGSSALAPPSPSCFRAAWDAARRFITNRRYQELTRSSLQLTLDLVHVSPPDFASSCLAETVRLCYHIL